jgi:hypothetical protein
LADSSARAEGTREFATVAPAAAAAALVKKYALAEKHDSSLDLNEKLRANDSFARIN